MRARAGSSRAAVMTEGLAGRGYWRVDAARLTDHSTVEHLGVSTVAGSFEQFAGELHDGRASGTVAAASVRTDEPQRDRFVRSDEFLGADAFPELAFEGAFSAVGSHGLDGELTIRGTSRPLTLTLEDVSASDGFVALRLRGRLRRRAYGLRFPQAMGAADHSVSDEVQLALELTLVPAG